MSLENVYLPYFTIHFTPSWKQTVESSGCANSFALLLSHSSNRRGAGAKTKNVQTCDRLGPFTGGYVLTFLGQLGHYMPPAGAHPCADLEFLSNSCLKLG